MKSFVHLTDLIINLDQVAYVKTYGNGADVYFTVPRNGPGSSSDPFHLYVGQDDIQILMDALVKHEA